MNLQKSLADKLNGTWHGERYFSAWCPFEEHRKPALLVYLDGFICLSCQKKGTLEYLKIAIENTIISRPRVAGKSYQKSILPRWRKWIDKYGDLEGIAYTAHKHLSPDMGYLKKRQITQFYEQGYFGFLDQWLTFPVFNEKRKVIDIVVRQIRGKGENIKYVICPYSETDIRPLYVPNWERVLTSDKVYIPFGILDAWAFEAIGLAAATGITGKSISPKSFEVLKNKQLVIVPDYNEWEAAYRLQRELGSMVTVSRLPYEYGIKDPDEIHRNYSDFILKGIILNAS